MAAARVSEQQRIILTTSFSDLCHSKGISSGMGAVICSFIQRNVPDGIESSRRESPWYAVRFLVIGGRSGAAGKRIHKRRANKWDGQGVRRVSSTVLVCCLDSTTT